MFNSKKGISVIVSISLLLIVSVVSVISFEDWFYGLTSDIISDSDQYDSQLNVDIGVLSNSNLYVEISNKELSILDIKINDVSCFDGINANLLFGYP